MFFFLNWRGSKILEITHFSPNRKTIISKQISVSILYFQAGHHAFVKCHIYWGQETVMDINKFERYHDKANNVPMHSPITMISLGIHLV